MSGLYGSSTLPVVLARLEPQAMFLPQPWQLPTKGGQKSWPGFRGEALENIAKLAQDTVDTVEDSLEMDESVEPVSMNRE